MQSLNPLSGIKGPSCLVCGDYSLLQPTHCRAPDWILCSRPRLCEPRSNLFVLFCSLFPLQIFSLLSRIFQKLYHIICFFFAVSLQRLPFIELHISTEGFIRAPTLSSICTILILMHHHKIIT